VIQVPIRQLSKLSGSPTSIQTGSVWAPLIAPGAEGLAKLASQGGGG
jgi:hypothetical protein